MAELRVALQLIRDVLGIEGKPVPRLEAEYDILVFDYDKMPQGELVGTIHQHDCFDGQHWFRTEIGWAEDG